jgi:hypothetical protein
MLIVGGALAFIAIGVFFAWRFIKRCQALWRERRAKTRLAAGHKSERVGAE